MNNNQQSSSSRQPQQQTPSSKPDPFANLFWHCEEYSPDDYDDDSP
jgi:hypothetical protein